LNRLALLVAGGPFPQGGVALFLKRSRSFESENLRENFAQKNVHTDLRRYKNLRIAGVKWNRSLAGGSFLVSFAPLKSRRNFSLQENCAWEKKSFVP
jgi:hypothetical protein